MQPIKIISIIVVIGFGIFAHEKEDCMWNI